MTIYSTLNAEQESLWYLGSLRIIKAIEEQFGHSIHLTKHILPAGTRIFANHHQDKDEGIYVVGGEAIFSCGEKVISATAGTLLVLPQNSHFYLEVSQPDPFHYLSWTTAQGFAHTVLHMGESGQMLVLSPPPSTPQERIQELAVLLRAATTPSEECYKVLLELWISSAIEF
jgi:mannose-6-phosphate isomerase-like protein (cupin superfamily)